MLVAWAKSSGLSRIAEAVSAHRDAGGQAEIVVGIDAQGGTWEGLELAIELFDVAYVFHDPGSPTFHPKVYLLDSADTALAWIGSGNLTRGGLFTNYEASIALKFDRSDPVDEEVRQQISAYIDWFKSQTPACQVLSATLLDDLRADPRDLVQSERERNKRSSSHRQRTAGSAGVFGSPVSGLASARSAGPGALPSDGEDEDSRVPQVAPPTPVRSARGRRSRSAVSPRTAALPGFYKRLANNDVSTGSSPGQMIIPIRFLDFFPQLITERDETATGGPRQMARETPAVFHDGGWTKSAFARVIYYEPARTHPRQNIDLRFTFRDREILSRLSADDYLVFEQDAFGLVITRRPPGSFPDHSNWL